MGCVVWYNGGMKRSLHISTPMVRRGHKGNGCTVRIIEGINTVKIIFGVNYGLAITNLMKEWDCSTLEYSPLAKIKFLGKKA